MKKVDALGFPSYQPTVLALRHMLKLVAYCGIFPNRVHIKKSESLREKYISRPRQNLLNIWNKICIVFYMVMQFLQVISFFHYVMSSKVQPSIRLETLFWLLLSGTCFSAFVIWNLSVGHDSVIKLLNEWAAVEQEIFGNRL